ncbi:hypothetical protein SGUI_3170 [Serinicoccus hydrothermalis]|uniref:Uncharacterized protein n=1 Tax=Serinicoccus hydrothermalis TaxID=1758689 RepID=A0A1B1NGK5_9MICO|nr:hypothetical protein [Serinicoccus hydrothermalis]ANS80566.1 hypothetical protein SGUI_3170 [Serinicoccus hydrothermalis]
MTRRFRVAPHRLGARVRLWLDEPERGDVPGWVLITIMTAALVTALLLVAEPLLTNLFSQAVNSVGT